MSTFNLLVFGNVSRELISHMPRTQLSFEVQSFGAVGEALEMLVRPHWDAVILDLSLPDGVILGAANRISVEKPTVPVILIGKRVRLDQAVELNSLGATDCLSSERLTPDLLADTIRHAKERKRLEQIIKRMSSQRVYALELSKYAMSAPSFSSFLKHVNVVIQEALSVPLCRFMRKDGESLIFDDGCGWSPSSIEDYSISLRESYMDVVAINSGSPVLYGGLLHKQDEMLGNHRIQSSLCARADSKFGALGVLSVHSRELRNFATEEAQLLLGIANYIAMVWDRTQLQKKIEKENEKFRSLFECSLDAIMVADDKMIYVDANPAACKLFGVEYDDLIGKKVTDFVEEHDSATTSETWSKFQTKNTQFGTFKIARPDGDNRMVEYNAIANFVPGLHLSTIRDVSQREKERAEQSRFFDLSLDLISIAGSDGFFKSMSPACLPILGFSPEEMCSEPVLSFIHPDDVQTSIDHHTGLSDGDVIESFEIRFRCKNGSFKTISWKAIFTGGLFYAAGRDVTEKSQMQAQLRHADRMTAIGTLAAGVAHEINNPLGYAINNLELALEDLGHGSSYLDNEKIALVQQSIGEASLGLRQVKQVVKGLKMFSREDDEQNTIIDLGKAIESAVKMARHEVEPRARLTTRLSAMPMVRGTEGRLSQVVLNLLINAAHAIPEGAATRNEVSITGGTSPSGEAVIEIRDTGEGISHAVRKRIFDPFFTTKDVGTGTGLGLPVCHGIISSFNGRIEVESELGEGSAFRIILPATSLHTEPSVTKIKNTPDEGCTANLVIIDDQPNFAATLKRCFRGMYSVEVYTDSKRAVEQILERGDADVILCDVMMPGFTGADVYAKLAEDGRGFEKRLIFMTGGAYTPKTLEFLQRVDNVTVEKPFSIRELRKLIGSVGNCAPCKAA